MSLLCSHVALWFLVRDLEFVAPVSSEGSGQRETTEGSERGAAKRHRDTAKRKEALLEKINGALRRTDEDDVPVARAKRPSCEARCEERSIWQVG